MKFIFKYRVVISELGGYRLAQLEKGWWFFWWDIKDSDPHDSIWQFLDQCQKEHPGKTIKIKQQIIHP